MENLRVAVVGAGILGSRHARVFHEMEGATLVAVVDPTLEKAEAIATPRGAQGFTDLDVMLEEVPCDAVAVATPDHRHFAPVMAALAAGRHVLVEKPLATSGTEARTMIAEAARRGLVLQVNYSQRFVPEYAWMREQIARGTIGRPVMVQSSRQDTVYVPTKMIRWAAETSPIFFMSSHDIDLVMWFLDATAEEVVARESRGVLERKGIAAHDGVDALVTFDSGAVASFHSSWILPESYPTLTVERMIVVGDEGMMHFESRGRQVECYAATGGTTVTFSGPHTANEVAGRIAGAFRTSLEAFLDAVRTGTEPATSAARTVHVVDIQTAILRSASTGEPVSLAAVQSA